MSATLRRICPVVFLGATPVALLVITLVFESRLHSIAPDFRYALYPQAHALRTGGVPFDPPHVALTGENRVYTVLTALLVAPLTWLPVSAAALVWTALQIVALGATLAVLEVRDWRVYGATLLSAPVLAAIQSGNVTLPLCLIAALAWRLRARHTLPGLLVGLAFALKIVMWPLAVWLVASRRIGSTLAAAGVAVASFLLILPFGSPLNYLTLAHRNADWGAKSAYSLYALLGASEPARIAWIALAVAALLLALFLDDQGSFIVALGAVLLCSPIVWVQYFAFLIVPLAIARPRFSPLWLLPVAYWVVPKAAGETWQIALALAVMFAILARLLLCPQAIAAGPPDAGDPRGLDAFGPLGGLERGSADGGLGASPGSAAMAP